MHRFPLAGFGCVLVLVGLLLLVHGPTGAGLERRWLSWIALTGSDLLIAGLAAGLSAEALRWSRQRNLIATLIAGAAVVAHRAWFGDGTTHWLLLCGLVAGLAAFPALLARHGPDRGWAYGLHLVDQTVFALTAGVVVCLGLELLLALMALLLGLDLPVAVHADTAIIAYGLIAPLLLLARVADPASYDAPRSMPPWLRWFAIWICVPLALAYLAVLEFYALDVVVAWDLPNGRLAWLTIGIAGLGLLAHLLAYPCRNDGQSWVSVYHRAFYPALLPILALCGLAVWQRIDSYGVTEARYLLCLLLAWLAALVPLSARERWWQPVYVPGVVALLLVVASLGPWNPTALAIRSQLERFQALLAASKGDEVPRGVGEQPVLVTPAHPPPDEAVQRQLQSIANFIVARGAHPQLAALLPRAPDWASERPVTWRERRALGARILADFGAAAHVEQKSSRLEWWNRWFRPGLTIDTDQARVVVWLQVTRQGVEPPLLDSSAGAICLAFDRDQQALEATMPDGSTIRLAFAPKIREWSERAPESIANFTLESRAGDHRLRLILQQLRGLRREQPPHLQIEVMAGLVLIE